MDSAVALADHWLPIDSDIRIPSRAQPGPVTRAKRNRIPWRKMLVGDSVFLAGYSTAQARNCLSTPRMLHGFCFAIRGVDGGARIWRTA